jgi:hypothetical protein
VGDIVQLAAGGLAMTVVAVLGDLTVLLEWASGGTLLRGRFDERNLAHRRP